uniref:Uncharacterized protein n=1 Tax=Candidatus Kentrum sp. DK TaxID=2126562 RepID=A0A450T6Q5_9GAMM|nr:MAG: hypothetical protein BECKDK2373B_GA0170837_11088 [Candidatus Kentron sp. DK]
MKWFAGITGAGFVEWNPRLLRDKSEPFSHPVRKPVERYTFGWLFCELYAKVASYSLTALKTSSKCSFIPYKLRFLVSFRLVMKHDPCFCMRLLRSASIHSPMQSASIIDIPGADPL